jgi:ABC-type Fe3+ transport system permease subunit
MSFARAVGEYGSVVFISGNMPMKTEITPLLIITKLEQYDYAGATALAVVMLVVSFALLLASTCCRRGVGRDELQVPSCRFQVAGRRSVHGGRSFQISPGRQGAARDHGSRAGALVDIIGIACSSSALLLFVPLAAVFWEALRKGFGRLSGRPVRTRRLERHPADPAHRGHRRAAATWSSASPPPGPSPSSSSAARTC